MKIGRHPERGFAKNGNYCVEIAIGRGGMIRMKFEGFGTMNVNTVLWSGGPQP